MNDSRKINQNQEENEDGGITGGDILKGIGALAATVGVVAYAVSKALPAAGFDEKGVRKDSYASNYMRDNGPIEKGSTFSKCQSKGAKGEISDTAKKVAIGATALTGAAIIASWFNDEKDDKKRKE